MELASAKSGEADQAADHDGQVGRCPAGSGALDEAVDQQKHRAGEQTRPEAVEHDRSVAWSPRENLPGQYETDRAENDVDQKHRPPAQAPEVGRDDEGPQKWTADRGNPEGWTEGAERLSKRLARERGRKDCHALRDEQSTEAALE
jgi:hypothetical protein